MLLLQYYYLQLHLPFILFALFEKSQCGRIGDMRVEPQLPNLLDSKLSE